MSEVKIQITTPADTTGAEKTTKELDNTQKAAKSAGDGFEQLTGRKRRLLEGFKALGAEIPIVNTLLMAGRNVYALLGAAAVAAFVAIRKSIAETKAEQAAYNAIASNVRVSIEAYSDLKAAIDAVTESQKVLADQTKSTNTIIQQQVEIKAQIIEGEIDLLTAEEQRQAALIERDTQDPVERARKLRGNELSFGARKIGLRAALGKEQVASIDQQIAVEREHQAEAGASVPNEAALRGMVQGIEKTRQELELALVENRRLSQRAGLLQIVTQLEPGEDMFQALNAGQIAQLREEGILSPAILNERNKLPEIKEAAARHLNVAGPESDRQVQVVNRLRGSLRAGIGQLPGRIASEGDIPAFMSEAEAKAAETLNASYEREQALLRSRERLERERANKAAVGGIQQQTAGIKGSAAINDADQRQIEQVKQEIERGAARVAQAARELGGATARKDNELADLLKSLSARVQNLERGRAGSSQASR